ncbi:hypothetical protein FUA48_16450 [Flavobacterium alkalisoli]|uniref:Uncharacterized protein n=1 Tax=Flavobacterium alkalisoli TaxID=2602769 RepID=A0A5B9FYJ7_9FLAO|nr:hypothetical protein [Flavobacterium alkalisoli]QEE51106.1 hypothetical protein FUA48_16450 [Flavobacterium alkalisoli]
MGRNSINDINIIYDGIGSYNPTSKSATYKVVLPVLGSGQSYRFGDSNNDIFNYTDRGNGVSNLVFIHVSVDGVDPDTDLSAVNDPSNVYLETYTFNLSNAIKKGPDDFDFAQDITVIICHDDQYDLPTFMQTLKKAKSTPDWWPNKLGSGLLRKL